MAWGRWGDFRPYVSVAQRRADGEAEAKRLLKAGEKLEPVKIEGRAMAETFWGRAWCEHIESYSDYESRLPRGRSYARNGSVVDLKVTPGQVRARVAGSELYELELDIEKLAPKRWKAIVEACAGKIDSVVELLSGQLSDAVMTVLCDRKTGVFPLSGQLEMSCSCPDSASLCKHLAAVLYGIGNRLDRQPELLFVLRGVDQLDLVEAAGGAAVLGGGKKQKDELDPASLSELFGISIDFSGKAEAPAPVARKQRKRRK